MIKAVAKYLLSFCLFLLCANNQAYADSSGGFSGQSSQGLIGTEYSSPVVMHLYYRPASSSSNPRKQTYSLSMPLFDNEEDDELNSFKKNLRNAYFPTAILFTQSLGQPNDDMQVLPVAQPDSDSSQYRYILIQVFRI